MDSKVKKILKYVLSFALAGGLIAYSCSKVDWSSFAKAMESCNWAYILLALLAGFVAMYFRALRWRLTIKPIAPSIKRMTAFHGVNIGNLSNMAVPYSGELVRCGVITSGTGAPYDQVLGTVALDRVWDLVSMFATFLLILLLGGGRFGEFIAGWVRDSFNASFLLIIAVLLVAGGAFVAAVALLRKRDNGIGRLCARIYKLLLGMWQGFGSCIRMKGKWLFVFYTIVIWGMYWLQSVCTINALGGVFSGLGLTDALCLTLIGSLASVLPAPGGFGTFHAIIQFALSSVYFQGIMAIDKVAADSYGMTYAIMAHETQAVGFIILGVFSLILLSVNKKKKI
jgi:uncharacterized protein (TIRG00374 family)